ncbi:MFS transporter [Mucilaginibacter sp. BT774]|uniref:MFS transporter n=1 Tax=Mucilaginibacter sp. BT774 TaxID=3062276 RepID=UPI00267751EC|nr:MFS transporter [Mucilaginibacter sp. BT774]MDO3625904.1 MFS transporter [Mucilaginibacter sp. BT774]
MASIKKKYFSGLSSNTILLACSSLFGDISTEMLTPILPIYLTQVMIVNGSIIGLIDGIAQATQNIIQGFSGYLSDKLQKRKSIALIGTLLSALSKPLIGLASNWYGVLAGRFSDRLGAGTRSAPRDALIAASVAEKDKGKAFGLESFGDNLGAFLGPLITVLLFFMLHFNIGPIFYLAVIPGLLSVLMMALVKEGRKKVKAKAAIDLHIRQFPKMYWKYLIVTALFGIGNSSNAFLILQMKHKGLSLVATVLVYAGFNLVAALISYPAGALSDKFGRKPVLLAGFIIFMVSYTGFAVISGVVLIGMLFIFYGLFQGIFRAAGKSLAADFIPAHLQASGIGWYTTTVGLSGLFSSIIAGQLWDNVSHASVFILGALCAFAGAMFLLILIPNKYHRAG